ncbi:hypothetical protein BC828DRAFT_392163 [Blastocladiella britannica]|nr:hypothetical protein BC828DRAFT_392163 [Blastocladiella britannica]
MVLCGYVTSNFYAVPEVVTSANIYKFSEERARKHVRYLSQDIGNRYAGTKGEDQAIHYIVGELEKLQAAPQVSHPFEVSVRQGSGQHLFEIMSVPIIKTYFNVTNIAVRIGCDECASDKALLVNTHFDTTNGNGAADAATPVAVMLDSIRALSQSKKPMQNSIVFLFNGAEESFQDASHLFMTTDAWFSKVVAVVNLEAAGIAGKSVLFQSKSQLMLDAYSQTSWPHGSSMANDLFKTGLLLSDTDYGQFMNHGNLPGGLDMAIYQHGYLYHTKYDREEFIPEGTIQHMGQNTLDILSYIAFEANLDKIYEDPTSDHAFFDFLGFVFVQLPGKLATNFEILLATISFVYLFRISSLSVIGRGVVDITRTVALAFIVPCVVALVVMTTDFKMLWFGNPSYASMLYGPFVLYGLVKGHRMARSSSDEKTARIGLLFVTTVLMIVLMVARLQTAFVMSVYLGSQLVATLLESLGLWQVYYIVSMTLPISIVQPLMIGAINTFVPLTGRMGGYVPAELIIAILVWLATVLIFLPLIPSLHKADSDVTSRFTKGMLALAGIVWVNFLLSQPRYTMATPKRLILLSTYRPATHEAHVHLIKGDSAPYPPEGLVAISELLRTGPVPEAIAFTREEQFDQHLSLYPLSDLTVSRHWNVTHLAGQFWADPKEESAARTNHFAHAFAPRVKGIRAVTHAHNNSRTITIPCAMNVHNHATVFRFKADVVSASAPIKPHARSGAYMIRHLAAGYGGAAERTLAAGHDLVDLAETQYPKEACDFEMVVRGTDPVEIEAAAVTAYNGKYNAFFQKAIPKFGNWTDVWAVDAVHVTTLV